MVKKNIFIFVNDIAKKTKKIVDRIVKVLEKRNNYFAIASTGSEKTIIFSHILKELLEKK
ncbi:hypothetical protein [Candidatus Phytoplasma sacchari]|nr:hypothetical protein [Candidatus Phytoplasma sacchari]KAB8121921.1 hypothetical protein F2B49_01975 [Candidatus Phytoplasma sacchari]